jgi:hypothetical protein
MSFGVLPFGTMPFGVRLAAGTISAVTGSGVSVFGIPNSVGSGHLDESGAAVALLVPVTAAGSAVFSPPGVAILGSGASMEGSPMSMGTAFITAGGMNGNRLQQLIYQKGYGNGAAKAGLGYRQFRATGALNPIGGPPLALLPALFSQDKAFQAPVGYGQAGWRAWLDGTQTAVGDLLIGPRNFFIAAQQPLLPILAVEAPRLVDIRRPFHESGVGFSATYGGNTAPQETVIMGQWPASILQGTRGDSSFVALPDDIKTPWWGILLPASPAPIVMLRASDIVQDDLGRRFTISAAELTALGWRLTALEAQT